ncbi:CotH kinase family protein [Maribacter sp.]|nr:CotH kinase family protein [Maribacter sp.]
MRRSRMKPFLILTLFLIFSSISAQSLKGKKGSFAIDKTNKMIVWHEANLDSISAVKNTITQFKFGKKFLLNDSLSQLSYARKIKVQQKKTAYALYTTRLPLIQIRVDTSINKNTKVPARFTYFNKNKLVKTIVGIEYRGNLSLTFPKKSKDLEFWSDSLSQDSKDFTFKSLRNDDDWILDGLYNEPLRIRSYIANNIWLAIHQPHYQSKEPTAKSGIDSELVEVFRNTQYNGIHALTESVDRKLLQLKKNDENGIHGELFKASSYEGGPSFKKAPEFENLFPHWAGFEMEYPVIDYKSHFDDLFVLVNLVVNGSDEEFASDIANIIDLDNIIDYFLFINLIRATDNLGKNYYIARYDEESLYFLVPWDLDGVMGIIQAGKRIPTTDDILSNGLFNRLLRVNPENYRSRLVSRWEGLRKTVFSTKNLLARIDSSYDMLTEEKVYEREYTIWQNEVPMEDHYEYLTSWLKDRLLFLDQHFETLEQD